MPYVIYRLALNYQDYDENNVRIIPKYICMFQKIQY